MTFAHPQAGNTEAFSPPDLVSFLAPIARRAVPSGSDPLSAAIHLNEHMGLRLCIPEDARIDIPGVEVVREMDDETAIALIIHRGDPQATAADIEMRILDGARIALVDARCTGHGDPDLIPALLASTVYLGNLAAFDVDIERAVAALMTPMRDGTAHRRYLTHQVLYWWAWRGIVRAEIVRRFGTRIAERDLPRALAHTRARLGAFSLQIHKRGLRFPIKRLAFVGSHVDGLRFTLEGQA